MSYGLPYMGSKNSIAKWIVDLLPPADNFYDLFAGGCAVTHRAMEVRKYKNYYVNDVNDAPQLFVDAIKGRFKNEHRWISHEEFDKLKDVDEYVGCCWSFGNNKNKGYCYSRKNEPFKKMMWEVIHGETTNERYLKLRKLLGEL